MLIHYLKNIPKEIGNFTKLKELDINCVSLKEIPKEIGNLNNLKSFNLIWRKNINKLPKEILNLNKLKNIQINHYFDR
ncbi:hypothetical protein EPJ79_09725 [Brachyspira aalborgi]|uniref:Leucine-rich repeat domain-containing protein n=1 Tax=Brachyspira aalborgi TaxID=29522 RepID=A0A5C8DBI8_9SPIR|nr:hypothetical protein [Brachyspira aalborgi]TXJ21382.1 hypothetical protein EPJ79_09725 [Brachyspira aalborgi]